MFSLFKKTKKCLVAPISGRIMKLSEVEDPVFSSGMMGVGIAIEPSGNEFVAPANCTITLIPESKHAIGMKLANGLEVLIHIGMDTVNLAGKGFTMLVKQGDTVGVNTPLVQVDREFFEEKKISLITPIVLLNHTEYDVEFLIERGICEGGKTKIINF